MAIVVTKVKYINHALVPEELLNLREGETVYDDRSDFSVLRKR
ncbi:MAG: hypothetical protein KatS3mg022_2178 [Armatimonadota bacterium]|nr:MAG: hypothetical protein KatS3mg022_2178 [Armatimonadota bacterium]